MSTYDVHTKEKSFRTKLMKYFISPRTHKKTSDTLLGITYVKDSSGKIAKLKAIDSNTYVLPSRVTQNLIDDIAMLVPISNSNSNSELNSQSNVYAFDYDIIQDVIFGSNREYTIKWIPLVQFYDPFDIKIIKQVMKGHNDKFKIEWIDSSNLI